MTDRALTARLAIPMRLLGIVGLLLLWEALAHLNEGSFILAGPLAILEHLGRNAPLLARATAVTLENAIWGFVYGNLAGLTLAAFVILVPRLERSIAALSLLIFCLPLVATGPILRILFGTGDGPQITLAALAVFYTTFLAVLVGLRAVPQSWLDLVRTHGRGAGAQLVHIRAAASIPYLIAALQIAAPAAFLGAMIGEFTGAERGLGVLTIRAMRALDVDATWAIASLAAAISIAAYAALGALGRRLTGAPPALILSTASAPRRRSPGRGALTLFLLILVPIVLWQGAMDAFDLNPFFAKRPLDVAAFFLTPGPAREALLTAFGHTVAFTLPGYLGGLLLGVGLACLIILVPALAATALPVAIALRSIPIVTTSPLIVLALGRGAVGTITIVAIMIFFPTLVACLQGLRQTPGQVIDVFDSYASGRWRTLLSARLPAMLPAFFAAARMGVPAAILAVTTAEWLATGTGIGSLMAMTASTSDYATLWSAIALVAVTAAVFYAAVARIERAVLQIYAAEQIGR